MANEIIDLKELQNKLTPRTIVIIIVFILVLIAAFSGFYTVDQKEKAVVLRFGKYSRTVVPGLHFKLPFGMEKNYNVPTGRYLTEEFGFRTNNPWEIRQSNMDFSTESCMLCGDLNIVDINWTVQYRIEDPRAWLFNVRNQVKTIREISQSVINQLVGDLTVFDIVNTERPRIEDNGRTMMNNFFNRYGLGIKVISVKLLKIMVPRDAMDKPAKKEMNNETL
jgi:membrane protease subunit HflK